MKNILYLFILIIVPACSGNEQETIAENETAIVEVVELTPAQIKSAGIQIGKLTPENISAIIKINGAVEVPPQNMVSVCMPLGGYLKSTKLLPGMFVSKGEVIGVMEDQQYINIQEEYLMVVSELQFAETEYQRQKALNQTKASSDKIFQQAEKEYQMKMVSKNALSEKLKLIGIDPSSLSEKGISKSVNIYSPINGFVSKVDVNIGKYVNPTDILFELVNPTDIHLNLRVFEKDVDKLAIGQKLIAYTTSSPDVKHECEIILITKDLSPERTAEVHCHFKRYDKTLLPGMYMNAEIEILSTDVNAVPEEAIVNFEGQNYLFATIGNNKFKMTRVETGIQEKGFIEIVNPGDLLGKEIAVAGAYNLLMALKNTPEE